MQLAAAAAALAACHQEHEVKVLLGPDPSTPSQGFLCRQDADPSKLLLATPAIFDGATLRFNVVIDVLDLGGKLPGCRGEELVAACRGGTCSLPASDPGARRYCVPVQLPGALALDRPALMAALTQQLRSRPVTTDAPDRPVLIRAVATSQPCAQIEQPAGGSYPALDGDLAAGCAYSCPAVLDDIPGPISLSLDTLTEQCEQTVRLCARFPAL